MTIGFTSCNKDDDPIVSGAFDGVITAQVENGNIYNNLVKRVTASLWDDDDDVEVVLASAPYANGGFTLTLPQTVDAKFLWPFDDDEFGPDVHISDKDAQTTYVSDVEAYSSSSGDFDDYDQVGYFNFYKDVFDGNEVTETGTYSYAYAMFMYADRDVNIAGTETSSETYEGVTYTYIARWSVSLKKGWNIVYDTGSSSYVNGERQEGTTYESHFTTTPVSGLKWYGYMYDVYGSPAKQAKNVREGGHKRFGRLGR